jgi:hypothetical protein
MHQAGECRRREKRLGLTITDLFPGEWEVRDEIRSGRDVDDGPGQCLHVDQRHKSTNEGKTSSQSGVLGSRMLQVQFRDSDRASRLTSSNGA